MGEFAHQDFGLFWTLLIGITLLPFHVDARHVPLTAQPADRQSRPRLLVIRPPAGSGQPNRIVLLANSRPVNPESVPRSSSKGSEVSSAMSGALADAPALANDRNFGGHPQSMARSQEAAGSNPEGRRSIRNLIEMMRNKQSPSQTSNIARVPETIPRAAPPLQPAANTFGELNMPWVIKAALRRLRQQARQFREPPSPVDGHSHPPTDGSAVGDSPSPFRGGMIDLSNINISSDIKGRTLTPHDPLHEAQRPKSLFSFGKIDQNDKTSTRTGFDTGSVMASGLHDKHTAENMGRRRTPSSGRRNADISTSFDRNGSVQPIDTPVASSATSAIPGLSEVISSNTAASPVVDPIGTVDIVVPTNDALQSLSTPAKTPDALPSASGADIVSTNLLADSNNPASTTGNTISVPTSAKSGIVASVNASANVSSTSAQTNTTSTKSVKTKTITMTTVVKGGTAADVAAAAASQAEIANAVAQGKEINSSSIAALSKVVDKKPAPNAGSITVKREPNGMSIITLSDGQGEPVVLRANGPVKIDRIIKPNGQIQFVINPIQPKPIDPELEIELDELTTTTAISLLGHLQNLTNSTAGLYPDIDFTTSISTTSPQSSTVTEQSTTSQTPTTTTTKTATDQPLQPHTDHKHKHDLQTPKLPLGTDTLAGMMLNTVDKMLSSSSKETLPVPDLPASSLSSNELNTPLSLLPNELAGGSILDPFFSMAAALQDNPIPPPPVFSGQRIPRPPKLTNPFKTPSAIPDQVFSNLMAASQSVDNAVVNTNISSANDATDVVIKKDATVPSGTLVTDAMPVYDVISGSPTKSVGHEPSVPLNNALQ